MTARWIYTACPRNCYGTCGFEVRVEEGRVTDWRPSRGHRAVPEGPCLKGQATLERASAKERLRHPLRKGPDGSFQRVSWDDALGEIAERLGFFRQAFGPQSIYFCTGSGMAGYTNRFSLAFWKRFGGATLHYGNLCWPAGLEATRLTLGENKHNAPWDLEHARLILFWGKNPAETNIHEMLFVDRAKEKGARVVVVDPRRTASAEKAHLLVQPRPGTDGALALGVAGILVREGWIDRDFIDRCVLGFEPFAASLEAYTPERVEGITGVPAAWVERLAREVGTTKPMTLVPGYGIQRYSNGGQTIRCLLALSILTGNMGKPGACWHFANLQSYVFDAKKEPLSYYPEEGPGAPFRRTLSMARLGEDMLGTRDPELKTAWVERGNPLVQHPDTNTVREAFRRLAFRVVVDLFLTDTAREADLVLPAKSMFEQSDLLCSYWHPYVQLRRKVIDPPGEVKTELEIYRMLARRLGYEENEIDRTLPCPDEGGVDAALRDAIAPFPSLDWAALREGPVPAPGQEEIPFAEGRFPTPSGKIELYSEEARKRWGVPPLPSFSEPAGWRGQEAFPLCLQTPNTKNRIHSQFGNLEVIRMVEGAPHLDVNPGDARARGIADGDRVRIFNRRGAVKLRARYDHGLLPGVVSVPNGLWTHEGGSVNVLTAPIETDMGHGAAFHDTRVEMERVE